MSSSLTLKAKDSLIEFSKTGEIISLTLDKLNIISSSSLSTDPLQKNKCYLMFPWQGRLSKGEIIKTLLKKEENFKFPNEDENKFPIHGLFLNAKREIIEKGTDFVKFKVINSEVNVDSNPFPSVEESFFLKEKQVEVRLVLKNESSEKSFFYLGYHPFFNIENQTINDFHINSNCNLHYHMTEKILPILIDNDYSTEKAMVVNDLIGKSHYDDLFGIEKNEENAFFEVVLKENLAFGVKDTSKGRIKFNYFQVYTPLHRKEICIEPLTAPTDAFNVGFPKYVNELEGNQEETCGFVIYKRDE